MEATLKFNLPEEKEEFLKAQNGAVTHSIIYDVDSKLRSYLKYGHGFKTPDEAIENVRIYLNDLLKSENIDIYQ